MAAKRKLLASTTVERAKPEPVKRAIPPIVPGQVWATTSQILQRHGRSQMWLWRKINFDPEFPKPIYDGRIMKHNVAEHIAYDEMLTARSRTAAEERQRSSTKQQKVEA